MDQSSIVKTSIDQTLDDDKLLQSFKLHLGHSRNQSVDNQGTLFSTAETDNLKTARMTGMEEEMKVKDEYIKDLQNKVSNYYF